MAQHLPSLLTYTVYKNLMIQGHFLLFPVFLPLPLSLSQSAGAGLRLTLQYECTNIFWMCLRWNFRSVVYCLFHRICYCRQGVVFCGRIDKEGKCKTFLEPWTTTDVFLETVKSPRFLYTCVKQVFRNCPFENSAVK